MVCEAGANRLLRFRSWTGGSHSARTLIRRILVVGYFTSLTYSENLTTSHTVCRYRCRTVQLAHQSYSLPGRNKSLEHFALATVVRGPASGFTLIRFLRTFQLPRPCCVTEERKRPVSNVRLPSWAICVKLSDTTVGRARQLHSYLYQS